MAPKRKKPLAVGDLVRTLHGSSLTGVVAAVVDVDDRGRPLLRRHDATGRTWREARWVPLFRILGAAPPNHPATRAALADVGQLAIPGMRGWTRLERGTAQGAYFTLPGEAASRALAIPFKEGDPIRVIWPDGTVSDETVKCSKSEAASGLAGIMSETRGVLQWLPLDAFEVFVGPSFPIAKGFVS
jgi:hypothetical protein